jgi:hypothetical protein
MYRGGGAREREKIGEVFISMGVFFWRRHEHKPYRRVDNAGAQMVGWRPRSR